MWVDVKKHIVVISRRRGGEHGQHSGIKYQLESELPILPATLMSH
jgi:hypothetical protein